MKSKKRQLSPLGPLHSELYALIWSMEIMLQYTACYHFGTDCEDVILMIKDWTVWPGFSTELTKMTYIERRFQDYTCTKSVEPNIARFSLGFLIEI